MAQSVVCFVIF